MMHTKHNTLVVTTLLAMAGVVIGQVTPGGFTPDACDDYESYPGARADITSLFGGAVPVIAGSITHNSVSSGLWVDSRSPGGLVVPCSGDRFGVGFGIGDFTLDFTRIGGINGFGFCASAARVGSDTVEFFDMSGAPMAGTYVDSDGFGPGDGTMEQLSFVSTVPIGSIRLTGVETAYDDLCYAQPVAPPNESSLTMRSGLCDCFTAPPEFTNARIEFASFIAQQFSGPSLSQQFDDTDVNEFFIHSFVGLPKGCIIGGTLTITVRPLEDVSFNDGLWLGQAFPGATPADDFAGWSYGDRTSSPPTLFPGAAWDTTSRPDACGYTVVIDLNTQVGTGPDTLIDRMNALGVLDVFSEDDTSVDCMVLELELEPGCIPVCDPAPCPADFDGDGVLDIFDFLAFQNAFFAGCP